LFAKTKVDGKEIVAGESRKHWNEYGSSITGPETIQNCEVCMVSKTANKTNRPPMGDYRTSRQKDNTLISWDPTHEHRAETA